MKMLFIRSGIKLSLLPLLLLAFFASSLTAQSQFGSLAVGASSTLGITVSAQATGSVSSIEVLTYGAPQLDFIDAAGSCASANFSTAGQTCKESITFKPLFPGQRLGAIVLLDAGGSVLATSLLQGTGTAGLAVFSPGNEKLFAGNGSFSFVGDGNLAVNAGLDLPSAVALDGAGNLYIADSQHNRIRMVSSGKGATIQNSVSYPQAGYITTVAGDGPAGYSGDDGPASSTSVKLNSPSGVAVDGAGNLYIADTGNHVIREVVAATGNIETIAGNGTSANSGDNGPAVSASLNDPWGVTADAAGNIFIADTGNHEIRAVCASTASLFGVACSASGDIVRIAGTGYTNASGAGGYSGDAGPATSAELNSPYAVAFDAAGNMYIPDSANNRVRLVTPAGSISTYAGTGTPGYYGDGGLATSALLQIPSGVAVDTAQNVLISDSQNGSIRKVSALTGKISTVMKGGVGNSYNGTKILQNALYGLKGITLDPYGNLYIANYFSMNVETIQSNVGLLDFIATPTVIGNTSAAAQLAIENDGNAQLSLTSIAADANSLVIDTGTTCSTSVALTVDEQCAIQAEFAPTTTGDPLFANITIDGQTDNSPLQLVVAGDAPPVNSTTINVSSSQNPSNFGQSINITATVATGAGTGPLTGTLSFLDGTTLLQSAVPLNALGTGTFTTSAFKVGSHVITAVYSGDAKHTSSTSSPFTQVVNENTAVTLIANANPATLGSSVTLTASVAISGGGGVPLDGQVAFLDGTTLLNTIAINAGGVATLTTSTLAQGAHSISAVYSGDPTKFVNGSTSATLVLDLIATSKLALSSTPSPSSYGNSVSFTATLTFPGTGTPTGNISFLDGAQQIGMQTLAAGSASVSFSTPSLAVGSHSITASYPGDQNIGPSTSNVVTQVVSTTQTSTTLTAAPSPAVAGTSVTLTAIVKPMSGTVAATGTVNFNDGTSSLGSAPLGTSGSATLTTTFAPGTHNIVAAYGGDGNDSASTSAPLPLVVTAGKTTVALTSSASPAEALSSVKFSATVNSTGVMPTGSITFTVDGTAVSTSVVDASGSASFTDSALTVGVHNIVASYAGDTDNSGSTSASLAETIQPIPTLTDLTTSTSGGNTPQSVLIATAVSSTGPVPTGTITFTSSGSVIGTTQLDVDGVATLTPSLAAGNYSIIASYGGDGLHAPSSSLPVTISGTAANFSVSATPPTLTVVSGQNGAVTLSIASVSGFTDTLQIGCLGLPARVTCRFSSDYLTLQANQTQTLQVTIDTNGVIGGGSSARNARPGLDTPILAGLSLPVGLLFGTIFFSFRRRHKWILLLLIALSLPSALLLGGCGTGITNSSAAPGTYAFQIGGTGTTTKVSQYQSFTLTVTK